MSIRVASFGIRGIAWRHTRPIMMVMTPTEDKSSTKNSFEEKSIPREIDPRNTLTKVISHYLLQAFLMQGHNEANRKAFEKIPPDNVFQTDVDNLALWVTWALGLPYISWINWIYRPSPAYGVAYIQVTKFLIWIFVPFTIYERTSENPTYYRPFFSYFNLEFHIIVFGDTLTSPLDKQNVSM